MDKLQLRIAQNKSRVENKKEFIDALLGTMALAVLAMTIVAVMSVYS